MEKEKTEKEKGRANALKWFKCFCPVTIHFFSLHLISFILRLSNSQP